MAVKANLTKVANVTATVREVDFVTRFGTNWDALREILGIMRPIRKTPGTTLTAYTASVNLQSGSVAEGDEIPYSLATVTEAAKADLTIDKYCKAVSIEAVNKYGAEIAVQKTDDAFLTELQETVMGKFYTFLGTGSLTLSATTFQQGVARAIGGVKDKFKKLHRTATGVVVFVNTLDAYDYLGVANISVQTAVGFDYLNNFMGATTMILSSEIARNTIIATPIENIDLYYVDPADSDFAKLGLEYTVEGETNLIGFHVEGNYSHAVGECYALMGMVLWAEYLDAIAVVTIGASSPAAQAESAQAEG